MEVKQEKFVYFKVCAMYIFIDSLFCNVYDDLGLWLQNYIL